MEDFQLAFIHRYPEDQSLLAHARTLLELAALPGRSPSVRTVAQGLLDEALVDKVPGLDIRDIHVYAPDLAGQPDGHGQSLLDILVLALETGREPTFDLGAQGLYASPDPIVPGPPIDGLSLLDLEKIVADLIVAFRGRYLARLQAFWQRGSGSLATDNTPRRQIERHLISFYFKELERLRDMAAVPADAVDWLVDLPTEMPGGQVNALSLRLVDGAIVGLPGVYALGDLQGLQPNGLWLWSATWGFEPCASLQAARAQLVARGLAADGAEVLAQPFEGALFNHSAQAWVDALLQAATEVLAAPQGGVAINQLHALETLQGFIEPCQRWLGALFKARRVKDLPAWLSAASEAQRDDYAQREGTVARLQRELDEHLVNHRSYQAFSAWQVQQYVAEKLGITVDPTQVMVSIRYNLLVDQQPLQVPTTQSLSDFALETLDPKYLNPSVEPRYARAGMTREFLLQMNTALDLRVRLHDELEQLHMSAPVQALMIEVLAQRMGLGLRRAYYQKAISPEHFQALDDGLAGRLDGRPLPFRMGTVFANGSTQPCRDLLLFKFGEQYVLYAPGAPTGRDFFTAANEGLLNRELASMATTQAGRDYLMNQLASQERPAFAQFLRTVEKLPTDWIFRKSDIELWDTDSFHDGLSEAAYQKVAAYLDDYDEASPDWYRQADRSTRQALGQIDRGLQACRRTFKAISPLRTFAQFARDRVQAMLDAELAKRHIDLALDVDTLVVQPEGDARMTLMAAVLQDIRIAPVDISGMRVLSTLNQALPDVLKIIVVGILHDAHVAQSYITLVTKEFKAWENSDFTLRMHLNFNIVYYEMARAISTHRLQGKLTEAQAAWLNAQIEKLGSLAPPSAEQEPMDVSGIYRLGLGGHCVEGLYLFRHRSAAGIEDIVYTPNAPDGVWLRSRADFHQFLEDRAMASYVYEHVRFRDRAAINRLLKDWEYPPEAYAQREAALGPHSPVSSFYHEFQRFVDGIIADVDDSTTTAAERFSARLETLFATALSLAVLPFPPAAMALNVFMTVRTLVQGVQAYQDGDNTTAFWHFFDVAASLADMTGAADLLKAGLLQRLFQGPVDEWLIKSVDLVHGEFTSELTDFLKSQTEAGQAELARHTAQPQTVW